jgi:glycosyltransferase involved in cell wall biosynthesis
MPTKLIIQVPCYNEEETLPATLADLPRSVEGFDIVEWLVIDDGSRDRTSEVARELGVHHIVRHRRNRGLAAAFLTGLDTALKAGADVIVNTDADNQYQASYIPAITAPVLSVMSVPIDVNPQTRESRLVKSSFAYVRRSASTIIRSYAIYRPFRFFAKIAAVPATAGVVLVVRWLYYFWFVTPYESRVPSLIVGGVLVLVGIQVLMIAFLAEMISISRRLLSESRFLTRQAELDGTHPRQ